MVIVLPMWGVLAAMAAPRFTGEAADAAVARSAWHAAEWCTGREGRADREVEIRQRTIPGGYLGVAHTRPDGTLFRIDLNADPERRREVLVHEVAHAWVSKGPIALVEGAAELLSDCMVAHTPGLATPQFDDGRDLAALRDLRAWVPPGEHATYELGATRTDSYIGAARLMRVLAMVVPRAELWPEDGLSWERLDGLLAEAGPKGVQVVAALHGGAATQRKALADEDLDGVPALAESLLGTSDHAFDTDGDGWWDGAHQATPADAVAVPLDGTPVCTGLATERGGSVHVYAGGNLRGHRPPRVVARAGVFGADWSPLPTDLGGWGASVGLIPPQSSVLIQLDRDVADSTGAPWARVHGAGLVPDVGCLSTAEATVWAHDRRLAPLVAPITTALHEAIVRAGQRFGPPPSRVAVALGGRTTEVKGSVVWLSTELVVGALNGNQLSELAYEAVGVHHVYSRGERDWRAGEALARSLQLPR